MFDIGFTEEILDSIDIFVFAKDKAGRYIYCNENFASVSGCASKQELIGKTDYDLIWQAQGDFFRSGDLETINGNPLIKVPEVQIQPDGIKEIITSKNILRTRDEKICGVIGSYIEITGKALVAKQGSYDPVQRVIRLGGKFGDTCLTYREANVLYYTLLGYSARKSALALNRSIKTVEFHIKNIKIKLQCKSLGDLIALCISTGLTYTIFSVFENETLQVINKST